MLVSVFQQTLRLNAVCCVQTRMFQKNLPRGKANCDCCAPSAPEICAPSAPEICAPSAPEIRCVYESSQFSFDERLLDTERQLSPRLSLIAPGRRTKLSLPNKRRLTGKSLKGTLVVASSSYQTMGFRSPESHWKRFKTLVTASNLNSATIEDFREADIIIIASNIFKSNVYPENLSSFASVDIWCSLSDAVEVVVPEEEKEEKQEQEEDRGVGQGEEDPYYHGFHGKSRVPGKLENISLIECERLDHIMRLDLDLRDWEHHLQELQKNFPHLRPPRHS
ncbi:hypothetical protein BDP27DRAFT_1427495 [Rhodocollybia butyracea]|uniref:Uncharacterized protein n=1 Tax=Rhodocollybia butyracea TaxID=206335 RepID=A0A9P5PC08_9AGAR|nr:hypothetical protein BDP27DRAFT_1427495 [Rhodocollybia butyracea]